MRFTAPMTPRAWIGALALVGLAGCSSAGTTAANTPGNGGGWQPPADACAGDPWLAQIVGYEPDLSMAMSVDGMRRTRKWGGYFASRDRVEMDHVGELEAVRSASAEVYEWPGPPSQSSSLGHETARVVVLRNAFGDPRALKGEGGVDRYAQPVAIANGVLEFAPTKANISASFAPTGGTAIYTFADGTWVKVDGWMAPRFRAAFAAAGASPPLPPSGPDVAWEICSTFDPNKAVRTGVWATVPQRGVLRFRTQGVSDAEVIYRFASPELARRAEAEQQQRCSQPVYAASGDKGLFALTPPCRNVASISVDGPMLRYSVRL